MGKSQTPAAPTPYSSKGFGLVVPEQLAAGHKAKLTPLAWEVLHHFNLQCCPGQYEVWFSQTRYAREHDRERTAVNRAVGELKNAALLTVVGRIQFVGATAERGKFTQVFDVTSARRPMEERGYPQLPEKRIKNFSEDKIEEKWNGRAVYLDGGVSLDQLAFMLPKPPEPPPRPKRKVKKPVSPDMRIDDDNEGVLKRAHPGCAEMSTQPYPSSNLNSPPTPSVVPADSGPAAQKKLKGEEIDALWVSLRAHSDFQRWQRTAGFSTLVSQIVAEKGFEATKNAILGAALDSWWGGREESAPEFVHMWHRLLAALKRSAVFERLAQSGSDHVTAQKRRNKAAQERAQPTEAEQELAALTETERGEAFRKFEASLEKQKQRVRACDDERNDVETQTTNQVAARDLGVSLANGTAHEGSIMHSSPPRLSAVDRIRALQKRAQSDLFDDDTSKGGEKCLSRHNEHYRAAKEPETLK